MICNNCNQETEPGKFCTKCGAPLGEASAQEQSATQEPIVQQHTQTPPPAQPIQQQTQQGQQVDFAQKTKELSSNFGGFFLNALKRPSSAKDVNGVQFVSGAIMVIVFSLIISLHNFIAYKKEVSSFGFGDDVGFFDIFIVPFLKYILLYAIIVGLIFAAVNVAQQSLSIQDVLAKYGAYLVPFALLYVIGILLDVLDMTGLPFSVVGYLAIIGPVLVVPVLILSEKAVKGFDYVYTTIGLLLLSYIAYSYITKSVTTGSFEEILNNLW